MLFNLETQTSLFTTKARLLIIIIPITPMFKNDKQHILKNIIKALDRLDVSYEMLGERSVVFTGTYEDLEISLLISSFDEKSVSLLGRYFITVPESEYTAVLKFINKINAHIAFGYFFIDEEESQILFRYACMFDKPKQATPDMVLKLIYEVLETMSNKGKEFTDILEDKAAHSVLYG